MERDELIKEVKKYFQLKELVCPHCVNTFGDNAWQFISTELLSIIYTLRTQIIKKPMIVNSYDNNLTQRGLRCNICQLCKDKTNSNRIYVSSHCFDKSTEILTNNGWKNVYNIQYSDKVYSYNINNDIIELQNINDIIKYNYTGKLYCAENQHISYAVTDQHRMLVKTTSPEYKRKTNKIISDKWNNYLNSYRNNNNSQYHIELAKDFFKKRRIFKVAGISDGSNEYDVNLLRFCMAVISDGYLDKKGKNIACKFNLKKERDKNELEDILKSLNWHYTKHYSKGHERMGISGVYTYYINSTICKQVIQIIGLDKKIPLWFLSLKPEILQQLIITYSKFDGSLDTRNNNSGITIFSIDEQNIDTLQAMCVLCGFRAVKRKFENIEINIRGYQSVMKEFYHLYITTKKNCSRMNEENYSIKKYNGPVWCINNNNTTLIIRRNGKVSIQGNCLGKAIDFTVNDMSAEEVRNLIRSNIDKFEYPIRLERDVTWVHVDAYTTDNKTKLVEFNG